VVKRILSSQRQFYASKTRQKIRVKNHINRRTFGIKETHKRKMSGEINHDDVQKYYGKGKTNFLKKVENFRGQKLRLFVV